MLDKTLYLYTPFHLPNIFYIKMNTIKKKYDYHRFSVAPMLNYTDKDCRYFYRQMTKKALLYTEMISTDSLLNHHQKKIIYNHPIENPIAIQLAGRIPMDLAKCAQIASNMGYDEINLNIGCPSIKIQNARYGACLMKETSTVINCIKAIYNHVSIPISIKTRIGLNNNNCYSFLQDFINQVSYKNYCKIFIIHARTACLFGMNPKNNRNIPKLKYDFVYQIKKDFPYLKIILNGGIQSIEEAKNHLSHVDGVMMGRAIYKNPFMLSIVDKNIFHCQNKNINIIKSIKNMFPYIKKQIIQKTFNKKIIRHIGGAFYQLPGAKIWKQKLHQLKNKENITEEIHKILKLISILYH